MSTDASPGGDAPDGAQLNIARDRATQNIVQHGNLYVGGPPNYRVDEVRPSHPDVPQTARRAPSRLLAARFQVVDFTGRESELAGLAAWREDPELGLAVRLVHGPGGQGKTRLAAQFAQRCAELGWTVAQAVHRSYDTFPTAALDPARLADSSGLLLIVDYAERWLISDLLTLAQDPLLRTGVPTRVLLLSRPAGLWWDNLSHRLADRFDIASDQTTLTALADTAAARTAVFTAARNRFAALFDVTDADQIPAPNRLDEDAFGLVLTVHMAALAAVDAHGRGESPPSDPAVLSAYLLKRERAHWQAMYDNDHRVHTPPAMMARAVFTATLTRPQPHPDGVATLRRVGIPDPEQVLDDHRLCYPPTDPATVCEPLYPDRLGEDFLALSTPGHNLTTHQPDPWADTAIAHLLAPTENSDGEQHPRGYSPQAVTVLIETARRWPHISQCQLFPLLREHPALALAAGGTALTRLANLPELDLDVLEAVEPLLPHGPHVDLDLAVAAITSRLTQHRLTVTTDPAERARLHATLGYRLAHAGQREEALAATTEAVDILRRLAQANPAAHEPDLALFLTNLGRDLSGVGRQEDALAASTEGVEIHRRLAQANPAAHEPGLALTLTNLGADLSGVGRRKDALAASTEAAEIHRRLAQANPAAHEPDLARSLINLGLMLSRVGRREDALTATTEAAEVYRRLTQANPAAHEPDLARSLTILGLMLSGVGRPADALAATTEAVDIHRRLAQANPAAHEPNLATSLNTLGTMLSDMGRREDALAATTEAAEIHRRRALIAAATANLRAAREEIAKVRNILTEALEQDAALAEAFDQERRNRIEQLE